MLSHSTPPARASDKAALRGEPSYVWRAGQDRRLAMIRAAAPQLGSGQARVLENGCGLGVYIGKLRRFTPHVHGLEYDFERAVEAGQRYPPSLVVCAAGEALPYAGGSFDVMLSNEVIEHVQDDRAAVAEMVRALRPGGRLVLFCPNRWYPVETHGIYWRGRYKFGNIPLVNYLPDALRSRLAPHVRAYTARGLRRLFAGLPVRVVSQIRVFGGYDNLIARFGPLGRLLRAALHLAERTPLNWLGLSHLLVVEKTADDKAGHPLEWPA
ncbi:MAG: class I SAM-dependent methyltransferase [Anaerolineales bacterium]|nr:class I SAM-dependent methyltransferase [Anaerolineales bacterium]